ncbi:hypothetical protein ES703_53089 [subsurface metagenome]
MTHPTHTHHPCRQNRNTGAPGGAQSTFKRDLQQIFMIWTGRYADQAAIVRSGAVPVCITVGRPRFRLQYKLVEEISLFAPNGHLFTMNDPEELRKALYARLDRAGIEKVRGILSNISARHGGRDLILLCFEDLRKPGEWCHRQLIADWLNENGMISQEIGEVESQLSLF